MAMEEAAAAAGGRRLQDVASACSADSFELLHLHLALRAAFAPPGPGRLEGCARLELRCARDGAAEVVLDAHPSLAVRGAALARDGRPDLQPLRVQSRPFARYGSALHLALPEPLRAGERLALEVSYSTGDGPGVSALGPPLPFLPPPPLPWQMLAFGQEVC